jgi:hypothetical protein
LVDLYIFDRGGEVLHHSAGPTPEWSGGDAMTGVYVWRAVDSTTRAEYFGSISLIR